MTGSGFCERFAEALDIYLDGEMPADQRNAMAKHLEECPECAREAAARQAFRVRLREAARSAAVPADLASKIDRRLQSGAGNRFRHPGIIVLAAAAMLAVSILVWRVEFRTPGPLEQDAYLQQVSSGLARIMRVGLNDHVHCAVFRKYPAQPPSLERMAQLLGPQYADLQPAFAAHLPAGMKVALAHRCSFRGRRYVHLIARDGARLVSLVIARREQGEALENDLRAVAEEGGTAMYSSDARQFSIAAFETPAHLVYLISDLGEQENMRVMESMAAQIREVLSRQEQQG
jgi:anti-sigma factor (TIGR02949 family)